MNFDSDTNMKLIDGAMKADIAYQVLRDLDRAIFKSAICMINDTYCEENGIDTIETMTDIYTATVRVLRKKEKENQ